MWYSPKRRGVRRGASRTLTNAALAVAGVLVIGVGAAVKAGYITIEDPTPEGGDSLATDTATVRRASGGEVAPTATAPFTAPSTGRASPPATAPSPSDVSALASDTLVAPAAPGDTTAVRPSAAELAALAAQLTVPVAGVTPDRLLDTFDEPRGDRRHNALDIPAPRGTPVLAAANGRILRLFSSEAGGLMIYAADPSERFILMYAHLDAYADGLAEGQRVLRGQTIGTVGTTGNAPPGVPHLHFAITRTSDVSKWWLGAPVDPRPLFQR